MEYIIWNFQYIKVVITGPLDPTHLLCYTLGCPPPLTRPSTALFHPVDSRHED